jgi:hypothetical protein
MNYKQLVKRVRANQLPTRMIGAMYVSEIPDDMPRDRVLEIISMAQIAVKYKEAHENGEYIPDDLTDEIFAQIKENGEAWDNFDGTTIHPKDLS